VLKIVETFGRSDLRPEPRWGSSLRSLWWERLLPLPKIPAPALGLRSFGLPPPQKKKKKKILGTPLFILRIISTFHCINLRQRINVSATVVVPFLDRNLCVSIAWRRRMQAGLTPWRPLCRQKTAHRQLRSSCGLLAAASRLASRLWHCRERLIFSSAKEVIFSSALVS